MLLIWCNPLAGVGHVIQAAASGSGDVSRKVPAARHADPGMFPGNGREQRRQVRRPISFVAGAIVGSRTSKMLLLERRLQLRAPSPRRARTARGYGWWDCAPYLPPRAAPPPVALDRICDRHRDKCHDRQDRNGICCPARHIIARCSQSPGDTQPCQTHDRTE